MVKDANVRATGPDQPADAMYMASYKKEMISCYMVAGLNHLVSTVKAGVHLRSYIKTCPKENVNEIIANRCTDLYSRAHATLIPLGL